MLERFPCFADDVVGRVYPDSCQSRGYTSGSLAWVPENWLLLGHDVADSLASLERGLDEV